MCAFHSPMVLLYYAIGRRSLIHNTIPCLMFQNNVLTLHEVTLGAQADISYGWYDWTYYSNHGDLPANR